jgi:hypothetical protein
MFIKKVFSFATVTLLVALALSSIAAYYSIQGLMAIFAAAMTPIMMMGGILEVAKVVTTVWLHKYWKRSSFSIKTYLILAVIGLAFLTSMGIFGFLSKAHSDQNLVGGDIQAKIAIYDQKIKVAKETIETDRKQLRQMDDAVDQVMIRSKDVGGADKANAIRKSQAKDRDFLSKDIEKNQKLIQALEAEAAPIRTEIRKVEADVGPVKYIAAFIYGDNPDSNLLERSVRWVIILIIFVFDPLALMLVLAAQSSYDWLEEDLKEKKKIIEEKENIRIAEESQETKSDLKVVEETKEPMVTKIMDSMVTETVPEVKKETEVVVEEIPALMNHHGLHAVEEIKTVEETFVEKIEIKEDPIDVHAIPPTVVEPVEPHGVDVLQTYTTDSDDTIPQLEQVKEQPKEQNRPEVTIQTEGFTLQESENGTHVVFEGKSMSKDALISMHPEFFAKPDSTTQPNTGFGTEFPRLARKGDVFVRIDVLPNRVYKFDSNKWIETNKEMSQTYLYDDEYLRYLVTKIETGEYDVDLLSEGERAQIEEFLSKNTK